MSLRTEDFDYDLPSELVAQEPALERDESRLMVIERRTGSLTHDSFRAIGCYLQEGDLLVANRSKVIPARIAATKATGGRVELLLIRALGAETWIALARPARRLSPWSPLLVTGSRLTAHLEDRLDDGQWIIRFDGVHDVASELRRVGRLPLPPYIVNSSAPEERYQTVYADREGSIAAPTAGLHFSPSLLESLKLRAVGVEFVTLHVGLGTFKAVTAEHVQDHRMHAEWGEVPSTVAESVNQARADGRRIIAVGTTTVRLLETATSEGRLLPFSGQTERFIYPGYVFKAIDGLVTNFHLPRSTLLMLVCAFTGKELTFSAYAEAVKRRYRFFSFGDAMLIL